MAAVITFRNALQGFGLLVNASVYMTHPEDIDSLDELAIMSDTDIHNLCNTDNYKPQTHLGNRLLCEAIKITQEGTQEPRQSHDD